MKLGDPRLRAAPKIWKYPIYGEPGDGALVRTEITIPDRATMLCAKLQHDVVTLWAWVRESEPRVVRTVWLFGTGHEMRDCYMAYIGTVLLPNGIVVHAFIGPERAQND